MFWDTLEVRKWEAITLIKLIIKEKDLEKEIPACLKETERYLFSLLEAGLFVTCLISVMYEEDYDFASNPYFGNKTIQHGVI